MQRTQQFRVADGGPETVPAGKEPLQVRIPGGVKRRFKAHAALRGMEPNELFVEMWEHYERTSAPTRNRKGT